MNRYFTLLLLLICFCTVGCVKKVKITSVQSNVVTFQAIPFEIHVADQLAYINGGEVNGKTSVDKVTLGGGVLHEWRSYDNNTYLYINHLHKDSKTLWFTTANGEDRELLFIEGIKFWHKKRRVVLQNGNSYWEELWLYHAGSDRIYIQVLSNYENVGFDPVKFIPVEAS